MIKAVIFDCFGVLVSESWIAFKHRHFADDAEKVREATDLMQQADAGLLSQADFIHQVAVLSGLSERQVRAELDGNLPNEALFAYIRDELKPKYRIGMLSNAGADWLHELFTDDQLALFDATALSFETGVTKPSTEAYEAIASKLGVEPQEAIFIDDQERHCAGAREAGMQALLFTGFEQFRSDLESLLANTLAK
jgi:putative hydrolase of the HAD superfamily